MTAIAGLVADDGRVWIGGDSLASNGWSGVIRADVKVFRSGPYLIGSCGSIRFKQLVQYVAKMPPPPPGERNMHRFMVAEVIEAVRACLKDGGHTSVKDGRESVGGQLLIGVRGALYCVEGDLQVGTPAVGYAATGSGEDFALGSLYTTSPLGWTPRRRITAALDAASEFAVGVAPPYVIKSVAA